MSAFHPKQTFDIFGSLRYPAMWGRRMKYVQKQLRAAGLWLGAASPFLYTAAQVLAAPLYPRYDWKAQLASELGTVGMASSGVFNAAIVLSGFATAGSSVGFKLALERLTASTVVPWLVAASLVSSGFASVWAGLHPLPSPMHNPSYWGAGTIAFPLLLAAALWRSPISIAVRIYLAGTAIAIVAFLIFSSDLAGLDLS
jgi:hypothetical membrane protein